MLITWLSVLPTVAYMYLKWITFLTCSLHESLILWFVTLFQWSVIESVLIWLDMKNNYPQWIHLHLILFFLSFQMGFCFLSFVFFLLLNSFYVRDTILLGFFFFHDVIFSCNIATFSCNCTLLICQLRSVKFL